MKKLNYLILALILMVGMSFEVKAATTDAACITASGKNQCVLSEDLVVSEVLTVQGDIELNLNGHTIRPDSDLSSSTGLIIVLRGGKLTIKDTVGGGKIASGNKVYAAVQVTKFGEEATGREATLVVDGGTLEGYYYGITGNGNRHNTSITINGGTITATANEEKDKGLGIYHPQEGTLVVNDGAITANTGIEMRSGTLIVNGGTITGTGELFVAANGNGNTTQGAGIAIAQHTTLKDINVQIKGGTISGNYALYESNPQNNANVKNQVNVSITGGEFKAINNGTAAVYSQDIEDFVVKGTFNTALDAKYVSDIAEITESNGVYTVEPDHYNAVTDPVGNTGIDNPIDTTYESKVYTAPVETYDVDLSWDDLHWVFVYEGDASNPSRHVWLTKEAYDTLSNDMAGLSSNEVNGAILNSSNLEKPKLNIAVANHSAFALNVAGSVKEITGDSKYTNPAGLKFALEAETPSYAETVNTNLATNGNANLFVKPTATTFVNATGVSTTVTGEVVLTFAKAN